MSINSNPRRDAHGTFAGYVYQVNVTILRWLKLMQCEYLDLEAGEDIDLVRNASSASEIEKERLMEQLKQEGRSITLRSPDALEAVANFCEHRRANPGAALRFRFLTTASIGKERKPWSGEKPAIEVWEGVRKGKGSDTERAATLEQLRDYLKECPKPADLAAGVWQALQNVLSEPRVDVIEEVIDAFEWATESGDHETIEQMVCDALQEREPGCSAETAKVNYRNLFTFVIKLLSKKGKKELTSDLLISELRAASVTVEDHLSAMQFRIWIDRIDAKLQQHESRIEALESRLGAERIK